MLTPAQNERLVRVGPGTPMGDLLRRYWMPIAGVSEFDPARTKPIRLMGEDLVLYKDLSGTYGLVQRQCPHRRADLSFGMVEAQGLRCSYHGWQFNHQGACIHQPFEDTAHPERDAKARVKLTAYPVQAKGGMLWAYMGPQPAPLLPDWEAFSWDNGFTQVVLATGVTPRSPAIEGIEHPSVRSYLDVLRDKCAVGKRVALIGAGGIGFDTAEFLLQEGGSPSLDADQFFKEWGVDRSYGSAGGLQAAHIAPSPRKIYLLQRKKSKVGDGLGKTTGWIHRTSLKNREVEMMNLVSYQRIDDQGLHILAGDKPMTLKVDTIVICAGQEPQRELQADLLAGGAQVHLIGGADEAAELDAKRAILQGTQLALQWGEPAGTPVQAAKAAVAHPT